MLVCLALAFLLPVYLHLLIRAYESSLTQRAENTPLVLGPRGNEFELVLRSLYFLSHEGGDSRLNLADHQEMEQQERGLAIPLHLGYTAQDAPVIGTSLDYFEHRQLRAAKGTFPLVLGDAVLGHDVAARLELEAGGHVLTDQTSLYNIAAEQPLRLRITGVLAPVGTPDDSAIFVDVKTAWVIGGIGHGHEELDDPENQGKLLGRDEDGTPIGSAAVVPYREITEANLSSFHFHGDPKTLPLTSLIVVPDSAKSATILKGHYVTSDTRQLVAPTEVVGDLLAIVFKVKRFFDASFGLVMVMTVLFLILVMTLTWKLRQRERETLKRIGCARLTLVGLQVSELFILLGGALALAFVLAYLLLFVTQSIFVL
ncbi:MAG: hypothetical protein GWQ08_05945 [Verrucomicrobiaceae bacterium]|nr:hypothetical protein [Verrucomicrobiaceae bacterium]